MLDRISLFIVLLLIAISGSAAQEAETVWSELKSGSYIVLMRHAVTEPGIGDPAGFRLNDCSTQRNLSERGRMDAKNIGEAFRARKIPVAEVLSSRWCRCLETARLAFGRASPAPMLDSMFEDDEARRKQKMLETFKVVAGHKGRGNLVLVTHARNIQQLTGISPASGEMVVVTMDGSERFRVAGRIKMNDQ